jgi:hypothetical protein
MILAYFIDFKKLLIFIILCNPAKLECHIQQVITIEIFIVFLVRNFNLKVLIINLHNNLFFEYRLIVLPIF